MPAATKNKLEAPWFGSFTPASEGGVPPKLEPVPEPTLTPEALSSVPNTYPAGRTYEGFLYEALSNLETALGGLATSGNVTLTKAPDVTPNYGVLSVGDGGFTGDAGHYSGAVGGSLIAVNAASGSVSDLVNLQVNGVSKWKVGAGGNVTLGDATNLILNTTTGTKIGTATSQKLGFFNVTPIIQPATNSDIRTALVNLGLLAGGVNPLNTNGGALVVGAVAASGAFSGSGSSFQFARLSYTFASDADATLSVTEKTNVILDIQAGVLSTTRVLDVVAPNAGGFWVVINRNANPVTVKIGANTGITVGATRSRILCAPGGTNMFSLTGDNNYAV